MEWDRRLQIQNCSAGRHWTVEREEETEDPPPEGFWAFAHAWTIDFGATPNAHMFFPISISLGLRESSDGNDVIMQS